LKALVFRFLVLVHIEVIAQKLIRLDNVAFVVAFVRINNPPSPTMLRNRAATAHDQPAALSLSATISQYFMLLDRLRQNRFMNNEEKA
jgi:hypothetical protein